MINPTYWQMRQKSKIGFIFVLYKTPKDEIKRLRKEIKNLGFKDYKIYFIDSTKNNRGYAAGVNKGICQGLKDNIDLFIIANPDISFAPIYSRKKDLLTAGTYFDIWGLAMKQKGKIYYGGIIDPWRLTGGLDINFPSARFVEKDFISGSLMIIKRKVIEKTGFFDERYFMYYEDVDYCLRAKKLGYKIGIDRDIYYEHFENPVFTYSRNKLLNKAKNIFFEKYRRLPHKIYNLINRLIKNPFIVNFFSLNVSSLAVKLIHFLNFLVLIRFLNTAEYGIYTLVWAQVMLFSPLADFGTTSYGIVHLPREKEKTYSLLFNLRIFISLVVFFLTIFSGWVFFGRNKKIFIYILMTATTIFANMFSGSYFILNAVRGSAYKPSRNTLIFNLFLVITTIISLFLTKKLISVFLVIFFGYTIYSFINFILIKKELISFSFRFDWKNWLPVFKKSLVFVLIGFFAGIYFKLDVFLLKLLKGEDEVGIYSAGYKFFEALLFLPASYNFVALPVFSRLVDKKNVFLERIKKDFVFLGLIGMVLSLGVALFSPYLLVYFLKNHYFSSVTILQIVIFTLPLILVNSILMNILHVFKKSWYIIFVFIFGAIVNLIMNWVLIPRYSYFAPAYITVISEIINFFILVFLVRYVWRKNFQYQS